MQRTLEDFLRALRAARPGLASRGRRRARLPLATPTASLRGRALRHMCPATRWPLRRDLERFRRDTPASPAAGAARGRDAASGEEAAADRRWMLPQGDARPWPRPRRRARRVAEIRLDPAQPHGAPLLDEMGLAGPSRSSRARRRAAGWPGPGRRRTPPGPGGRGPGLRGATARALRRRLREGAARGDAGQEGAERRRRHPSGRPGDDAGAGQAHGQAAGRPLLAPPPHRQPRPPGRAQDAPQVHGPRRRPSRSSGRSRRSTSPRSWRSATSPSRWPPPPSSC